MNTISRRDFIKKNGIVATVFAFTPKSFNLLKLHKMADNNQYDVIIVGGSYSGLAAGMALGRALRKTLIIDSGKPCNMQTPYSHNFLTQDGRPPHVIAASAKEQVEKYDTVKFLKDKAIAGVKTDSGFLVTTENGEMFNTRKLIFATGISDQMPDIPGYSESWGISVLHCPYCHGYEVRGQKTGILGNGDFGFEFSGLISNWTKDLTLYSNGKSTLTSEQAMKLKGHNIEIIETEIERLEHKNGHVQHIIFKNGSKAPINAIYARSSFVQHCNIPESLGCELSEDGYIKVNPQQKTTVSGVFACGDNATRIRTVANAVAMGTTAGMMANKELIETDF